MKKCSNCNTEKDFVFFGKRKASKDGLSYICKECKSLIDKEYSKNNKESLKKYLKSYYEENKESLKDKSKKNYYENIDIKKEQFKNYYINNSDIIKRNSIKYYEENKEYLKDKNKKDYKDNPNKYKIKSKNWYKNNKEKIKEYNRKYNLKNKEKIKEYRKNYYLNNKVYINEYMKDYWNNKKHIKSWRRILYRYFKFFSIKKNESTLSLLKYTPEMLRMRIECQFKNGMSWENYGEWEIDHKKPLSKFTIDTKPCIVNALCNLQPLWKEENRFKSNKWK